MIPSLIERIQREEINDTVWYYNYLYDLECKKERDIIPYFFTLGTEVVRLRFEPFGNNQLKEFRRDCGYREIMPRIVDELAAKLEHDFKTKLELVYNEKLLHDAKLIQKKEEEDRIRRQAELKRQEEERKIAAEKLRVEQVRLYQIQQEQHRQKMELMNVHLKLFEKHSQVVSQVGLNPVCGRVLYNTCPCCNVQFHASWHH